MLEKWAMWNIDEKLFANKFIPATSFCYVCGKDGGNIHSCLYPISSSCLLPPIYYLCDSKECQFSAPREFMSRLAFEFTRNRHLDTSIQGRTVNVKRSLGECHSAKIVGITMDGDDVKYINLAWHEKLKLNSTPSAEFEIEDALRSGAVDILSKSVSVADFFAANPDFDKEITIYRLMN